MDEFRIIKDNMRRAREADGLEPQSKILRGEEAPKRHKYGARKKEVDGITFDSTAEANRYVILKEQLAYGAIHDLSLQPRYLLQEAFRDEQGKWNRKIEFVGDFRYFTPLGTEVCEDVKGLFLPVFALKRKLFAAKYPHVRLDIISTRKMR